MEIRLAVRPLLATFCVQSLAVLGGIALAVIIGRLGGAAELGKFTVALSLLGAFSMLARRGQRALLTRAAAWSLHEGKVTHLFELLVSSLKRVVKLSLFLGLIGAIVLESGLLGVALNGVVYVFPIALLLITILSVFSGYARGTGRPWLAPIFEIGGISFLTAGLVWLYQFVLGHNAVEHIGVIFLSAAFIMAGVAAFIAWIDRPVQKSNSANTLLQEQADSELRRGQLEFTLIALGNFLFQSGSFILAAPFLSEIDVGLLRAAERLAMVVSFPMLVINPVIVSRIVPASRTFDVEKLRRLMATAVIMTALISLPVLTLLIVKPAFALSILGEEFVLAVHHVRGMAIAQFVTAILAPFVLLFNMGGRERVSMWINICTLFSAIILIPLMCHFYGANGFVAAYCSTIGIRSILILLAIAHGRGLPGALVR